VVLYVVLLFLLANPTVESVDDWDDLDYYEILGLKNSASLDEKEIKKAYRREAKLWHPDKTIHRDNNVTVEEANQRFARIAEAYQVLSDQKQRLAYDKFLASSSSGRRQREQPTQQGASKQSSFDFGFEFNWEDLDPRRIFEEMFGSQEEGSDESNFFNDAFSWFDFPTHGPNENDRFQAYGNDDFQRDSRGPDYPKNADLGQLVHVQEEETTMYDPYSGQESLRIIRTEEFFQPNQQRYYTRVLGFDFVEDWDARSRSWILVPLRHQPLLLHESYRPATTPPSHERRNHPHQQSHQPSQSPKQHGHYHPPDHAPRGSILLAGEVLMEHEYLSLSTPSTMYMAGVSPECNLEVVQGTDDDNDMTIHRLWSSDASDGGYFAFSNGPCILQLLNNGRLVLVRRPTTGAPPVTVWSSSDNDDDWDHGFFPFERPAAAVRDDKEQFMARLEPDGALVVYRAHPLPGWLMQSLGWNMDTRHWPAAVRAIHRFWIHLLRWMLNIDPTTIEPGQQLPIRLSCQFSTSLGGCIRPARFLVHGARRASRLIRRWLRILDEVLDELMS